MSWFFLALVISTLSNLVGFGGGILLLPLLILSGVTPIQAIGMSSLCLVTSSFLISSRNYFSSDINYRVVVPVVLVGLIFSPLGAKAAIYSPETIPKLIFVFYCLYTVYKVNFSKEVVAKELRGKKVLLISILIGFLSGYLGIGGGIILVPLLIYTYGISIKEATATSLAVIFLIGIGGALTHYYYENYRPEVLLPLLLGSVSSVPLNLWAKKYLGARNFKPLMTIFLLLAVLSMSWTQR